MHAVQTLTRLRAPEIRARTDLRFGFQRRRRVLLAWLTTLPKLGPLPQYSHFIAIILPIQQIGFARAVSIAKEEEGKEVEEIKGGKGGVRTSEALPARKRVCSHGYPGYPGYPHPLFCDCM